MQIEEHMMGKLYAVSVRVRLQTSSYKKQNKTHTNQYKYNRVSDPQLKCQFAYLESISHI